MKAEETQNETLGAFRYRRERGSIMIVVLIMIVLTAAMLTLFIDKASTDLIIESRYVQRKDMRQEAYSAMEVTLAVLSNFLQAQNNALHSTVEGWGDPLGFAEWEPPDGLEITVSFEDESGRISLPTATAATLNAVFQLWEMSESDAQELTDALLSWMRPNYTPTTAFTPDYDRGDIPYAVPARSLLSYEELAAIDVASKVFYGEDGLPNDLWWKFKNTFSLYNYAQPNINALPVRPEVLVAIARFDETALDKMQQYLTGTVDYEAQGPGYFRNSNDSIPIIGSAGNIAGVGAQIRALRVFVNVREGQVQYQLSTLITLPNGATSVQSTATNAPTAASGTTAANPNAAAGGRGAAAGGAAARGGAAAARGGAAGGAARGAAGAAAGRGGAAGAAGTTLQYPFTVLEIRENIDPIPTPPAEEESDTSAAAPSP